MYVERTLALSTLLRKKSHFLFGPRGTGKSSLIEASLPSVRVIDLLEDDVYSRLIRRPSLLGEMIFPESTTIVIDEIQKIPALLDEVHRLIEGRNLRFLLTGSSARKLRHGGANLLGGRAWEALLFPLTRYELGERFDLIQYLNRGGLPAMVFSDYPADELRNYVRLYVREEIQAEALVKRLDHFVRFLDAAAVMNGEEINFEAVASDAGVPARTVASYFEVLQDTLIAFLVPPFAKTRKRKAIKRSKLYFFDVGVVGALAKRSAIEAGSELFGRAFEHFIAQELRAFLSYKRADIEMAYWRSLSKHEVDFVLGDRVAIEVKATDRASERHLVGLRALLEENVVKRHVLISNDPIRRKVQGIEIVPWTHFLDELWHGEWV